MTAVHSPFGPNLLKVAEMYYVPSIEAVYVAGIENSQPARMMFFACDKIVSELRALADEIERHRARVALDRQKNVAGPIPDEMHAEGQRE